MVADVSSADFGQSSTLFYHSAGATLSELVEARVHVEALMARLAAERKDPESAVLLRASLSHEAELLDTDEVVGSRLHMFHSVVAGMSGNRVLSLFGRSIVHIYAERIRLVTAIDRADVHATHKQIGAAILTGRPAAAERLMREHLEEMSASFAEHYPGLADEIIDWR